jgi:hypothetical protein
VDIRDYRPASPGMDLSDTITRICPCGSNLFRTVVSFDEDYEIALYFLEGECLECGTRVKLPTPLDKE